MAQSQQSGEQAVLVRPLIAAARQQIFWKRARQRGTLTGGST